MLEKLCLILRVTGASRERVCDAISRGKFSDFEDCLQDECAQEVFADYIVRRNVDDFKHSHVKAITPEEFLQRGVATKSPCAALKAAQGLFLRKYI